VSSVPCGASPREGRKASTKGNAHALKINVRISLTGKDLEITKGQIAAAIMSLAALAGWVLMR
jgi:hypothetical protein